MNVNEYQLFERLERGQERIMRELTEVKEQMAQQAQAMIDLTNAVNRVTSSVNTATDAMRTETQTILDELAKDSPDTDAIEAAANNLNGLADSLDTATKGASTALAAVSAGNTGAAQTGAASSGARPGTSPSASNLPQGGNTDNGAGGAPGTASAATVDQAGAAGVSQGTSDQSAGQ